MMKQVRQDYEKLWGEGGEVRDRLQKTYLSGRKDDSGCETIATALQGSVHQ